MTMLYSCSAGCGSKSFRIRLALRAIVSRVLDENGDTLETDILEDNIMAKLSIPVCTQCGEDAEVEVLGI